MRGRNHLFVPGPTNMPDRVRRAMDLALEDHRGPQFPEFSKRLFEDVKKIFRTEAGQVFIFPASGTGGWEAAITNTLSPGDKVLQAVFGQFSLLWADLCKRHKMDVIEVDTPWGEGVPLDRYREILAADTTHEIKGVIVTHNETATGVTSDVKGVRDILDDLGHPALLFVDGVSSIGCIDFRMDEWGVDLAVAGSQKGFMLPTGLALVGVSPKALAARANAECPRCFFDFDDMINTNKDGWFPYTPAATLLHGLREAIDMLLDEGLDNVVARHHRFGAAVRQAVDAWGLTVCAAEPKWYSDTVTAIVVPEGVDSNAVINAAYDNYHLSLGLGLNKVAGRVFRIGHLGDLNELMVLSALSGVEMAMRDAGIDIVPGSGVAAAQEYLRTTRDSADAAPLRATG
jgi:alanine-glyoxylate transaminase / serine-glyoxylate transaminase / serine-pyruvate transaminase